MTCHYLDASSVFNWSCHVENLLQPSRSATQIWEVTRYQYGVFALVLQTSFRGKINSGVAECRLFSWATFKSNHHHSELTNRNVALRDAHCNPKWEQPKRFIFLAVSRRLPCACDWKLFSARGAKRTVFDTRHTSWDSGDIFCPLNVGFCELASHKQKNQHWEGRSTTFCRIYGYSTGCPNLLWRELLLKNLSLSLYKTLV